MFKNTPKTSLIWSKRDTSKYVWHWGILRGFLILILKTRRWYHKFCVITILPGNPFPQIGNPFWKFGNSFPRFTHLVLSNWNSFIQFSQFVFFDCSTFLRITLFVPLIYKLQCERTTYVNRYNDLPLLFVTRKMSKFAVCHNFSLRKKIC